jgi:hypothetical protein
VIENVCVLARNKIAKGKLSLAPSYAIKLSFFLLLPLKEMSSDIVYMPEGEKLESI